MPLEDAATFPKRVRKLCYKRDDVNESYLLCDIMEESVPNWNGQRGGSQSAGSTPDEGKTLASPAPDATDPKAVANTADERVRLLRIKSENNPIC